MNEKRGMNPGEDGGIDPLIFFCRRRRQRRIIANAIAAAPSKPRGMPTPRPIFSFFVKPWGPEAPGADVEVDEDVGFDEGSLEGSTADADPVAVGLVGDAIGFVIEFVAVAMLVEKPELARDAPDDCDVPEDRGALADCDAVVDCDALENSVATDDCEGCGHEKAELACEPEA